MIEDRTYESRLEDEEWALLGEATAFSQRDDFAVADKKDVLRLLERHCKKLREKMG